MPDLIISAARCDFTRSSALKLGRDPGTGIPLLCCICDSCNFWLPLRGHSCPKEFYLVNPRASNTKWFLDAPSQFPISLLLMTGGLRLNKQPDWFLPKRRLSFKNAVYTKGWFWSTIRVIFIYTNIRQIQKRPLACKVFLGCLGRGSFAKTQITKRTFTALDAKEKHGKMCLWCWSSEVSSTAREVQTGPSLPTFQYALSRPELLATMGLLLGYWNCPKFGSTEMLVQSWFCW